MKWWQVALAATAVGGAVWWAESGSSEFERLASGFTADVAAGRYDAAYARTASGYRSAHGAEQFRAAVSKNVYLRGAKKVVINEFTLQGHAARTRGLLVSSAGDVRAEFDFTEEQNTYRITGVTLAGTPALGP